MTTRPQASRFHALLVEGIPGAGKSTLIDALIRRHIEESGPRKVRSFLHLAQTHTYGPLASAEDDRTLTTQANQNHIAQIAEILEWLHAGVQNPKHPPCFVLIDTLHLTHCLRPGVITWQDALDVDNRLAALGVNLVVLVAKPETVWDRLILDRSETQFLREYCAKFGSSDADLHAYFMREQNRFCEMFESSKMPKMMIPTEREPEAVLDIARSMWLGG